MTARGARSSATYHGRNEAIGRLMRAIDQAAEAGQALIIPNSGETLTFPDRERLYMEDLDLAAGWRAVLWNFDNEPEYAWTYDEGREGQPQNLAAVAAEHLKAYTVDGDMCWSPQTKVRPIMEQIARGAYDALAKRKEHTVALILQRLDAKFLRLSPSGSLWYAEVDRIYKPLSEVPGDIPDPDLAHLMAQLDAEFEELAANWWDRVGDLLAGQEKQ